MRLIGAPFDLCGHTLGSRLGPAAIRLANLAKVVGGVGIPLIDAGDISASVEPKTARGGLLNFEPALAAYQALHGQVLDSLEAGERPLVVGGDHSLSIGSISAALKHYAGNLAVLWIDAHVDLNTPATSPSGNLHGMPLACLMGTPSGVTGVADTQWQSLLNEFATHPLKAQRSAWFGIRDVDEGEAARLASLPHEYTSTMYDIDRRGIVHEVERFDDWMRRSGTRHLWISFDVDCLDPILAPGTGTAVRGGLSYREMHLLAEMLYEYLALGTYELVGLDIVEINPILDAQNVTAKTAVEWLASLLGKTILGVPVR